MTSAARPRARTRALTGTFAAFSLSFGMIMTSGATPANAATWPSAKGSQPVSSTISVSGTRDGGMVRYYGSGELAGDGQEEGQDPIFKLAAGATLKNVIIGAPGADGIHCEGNCTLQNVWWEDVGEDAATFRGGSTYTVTGGGAKNLDDRLDVLVVLQAPADLAHLLQCAYKVARLLSKILCCLGGSLLRIGCRLHGFVIVLLCFGKCVTSEVLILVSPPKRRLRRLPFAVRGKHLAGFHRRRVLQDIAAFFVQLVGREQRVRLGARFG